MRAIKIMTVAVAALFLLMVFQNSYSQSNAIAEAKEVSVLQPTTEASSPAEPKDIVSDSGPIQSVPGPPLLSGSITQPRAQFVITEAILMVIAFVILGLIFFCVLPCLLCCLFPFIILAILLGFFVINPLFIILIMVLPVLLASFSDISTYEIPGAIQAILKDIGSKGTLTEIAFAYLKNLWRIVVHLPEIVRLTGNLDTGDYAVLIKRFGSLVLNYPRNLRALPNKILHNLFPTVNALPAWLRQAPVLFQVFPLLMYTLIAIPIIGIVALALVSAFWLTVMIGLLPIILPIVALCAIPLSACVLGFAGLLLGIIVGFVTGFLCSFICSIITVFICGFIITGIILILAVLVFVCFIALAFIAAIIAGLLCLALLSCVLAIIIYILGIPFAEIPGIVYTIIAVLALICGLCVGAVLILIAFVVAAICGVCAFPVGCIGGIICGAIVTVISFPFLFCFSAVIGLCSGLSLGVVLGAILACLGAILTPIAILLWPLLLCIACCLSCLVLIAGAVILPILFACLIASILPLMLPIGPQAVNSYPYAFNLCLSLSENAISIPLGCCVGLPTSACLSFFRGLPGSLRALMYHVADFALTPFILFIRALPLIGTLIVLMVLWVSGLCLAIPFSIPLSVAPAFIILALFVQGLTDKKTNKDAKVLDTDEIKKSIDNMPKNMGEVDKVMSRVIDMLGKAATTDISGLLDSLLGVDWLIATQNLPYILPAAIQAVGSAVPAVVNSCPSMIKTLVDSSSNLIMGILSNPSTACTTLLKDCFAFVWAMPKIAILIPQLLEILSVLTINFPALIRGFIPASVETIEQTTVNLPELCPSIVLSTMGMNPIVLQFAKGIWDMSANIFKMITDFLWSIILYLPKTVFNFDECVTPWFGPRLLSVIGLCCGAIPSGFIGICAAIYSLTVAGCLASGMVCYMPAMVVSQIISAFLSLLKTCCTCVTCPFEVFKAIFDFVDAITGCLDAGVTLCNNQVVIAIMTLCIAAIGVGWIADIIMLIIDGFVITMSVCSSGITSCCKMPEAVYSTFKALIYTPLDSCFGLIGSLTTSISLLTSYLLPVFFAILVGFMFFPLVAVVVAFAALAVIYLGFYWIQIVIGTILMACSGIFQSVVCVPLMSLCEPVPVVSTLLEYLNMLTNFYAFCIPPNVIEIITQSIPLCVNLLAACPAITFMPISLLQTTIETSSRAVEVIPSAPAYITKLGNRIIFSFVAECSACISLLIDITVALVLMLFSCSTNLCGQCLSMDMLTKAPQIAILVLALIFVIFAWVIDLCGIMCLRAPDMINEYANSILKSMAMMPILSAIVPGMAGAPAQMRPEVVSKGISQLAIILVCFIPAVCGALATLIYNLFKEVFMWLYGTAPSLFLLPCNLCGRAMDSVNRICSGMGSALGGAASTIESQLVPYVG